METEETALATTTSQEKPKRAVGKKLAFTRSDLEKIVKLYCENHTLQEIADIFSCNRQTIANTLKKHETVKMLDAHCEKNWTSIGAVWKANTRSLIDKRGGLEIAVNSLLLRVEEGSVEATKLLFQLMGVMDKADVKEVSQELKLMFTGIPIAPDPAIDVTNG